MNPYDPAVCRYALFILALPSLAVALDRPNKHARKTDAEPRPSDSCAKVGAENSQGLSFIQQRSLTTTRKRLCINNYADGLDEIRPNLGDSIRDHPLTANVTSQRQLILGAGSGSTATHSLQRALRLMGLTTSHYTDNLHHNQWASGILTILGGAYAPGAPMDEATAGECRRKLRLFNYSSLDSSVEAVLDTPIAETFIDIILSFPRARVILTTRPPADWVKSRIKRDMDDGFVPLQEPCGLYLGYGRMKFSSEELATLFDLNNRLVRCVVPTRQLFEVNVWTEPKERMDNIMEDLALFLGIRNFSGKGVPFPND